MVLKSLFFVCPVLWLVAMHVGCDSNKTTSQKTDNPPSQKIDNPPAPVTDDSPAQEAKVTDKKQPPPVLVDDDDAQLNAAIAEARATVDNFIQAISNPKPNQTSFSVKVGIVEGDQTEYLWLVPVRFENGKFIGRVNNEPFMVTTVKFGDEVTVAKDEISDWLYMENRTMMGGFTVRILMASVQDGEKPVVSQEMLGIWSKVSIDKGAGLQLQAGFGFEVTSEEIYFIAPNGEKMLMGQIHRIDSAASPCEIDLKNENMIGLGIYELTGNTLKLIVRDPGAGRPTEFAGSAETMFFSLERD